MPDVAKDLEQAVRQHRQGRLDEAERLYRQVVDAAPDHFDALHLLGMLELQKGRHAEAAQFLARAVVLNPNDPFAAFHLGCAEQELKRYADSVGRYDTALRLRPDFAEAANNRANALRELGRREDALASFDRAIAAKPDFLLAFYNRGNLLRDLGRQEEALASYDRALALKGDFVEAWVNRGTTLNELKRYAEALASFERALSLRPGFIEALQNRGVALAALGRYDEALASHDQVLAAKPEDTEALNGRGNALRKLKRPEEALASYEHALALRPDHADALNNRGNALRDLGRPQDALASYALALAAKPDFVEALNNKANALRDLGRRDEALACYAQALVLDPDDADAHAGEAMTRLILGDFARGWRDYEWRWKSKQLALAKRDFAQPLWLGQEALAGKTILLHAEQGLGDTIQFCRYASEVARRGAKVILEAPPVLVPLLATLAVVAEVVPTGTSVPAFDFHCPLMSLPLALGTELATIPAPPSYLAADTKQVARWQAALGTRDRPRIGLAWSGNAAYLDDRRRSIALQSLAPLHSPDWQLISLQKELRREDRQVLAQRPDILPLGEKLGDFGDTAAVIAQLDLVIAVDTAVAHLAGALGKPFWVLLPFAPDWRWLLGRDDSPWYPTARLFRQSSPGDWDGVIARVVAALAGWRG